MHHVVLFVAWSGGVSGHGCSHLLLSQKPLTGSSTELGIWHPLHTSRSLHCGRRLSPYDCSRLACRSCRARLQLHNNRRRKRDEAPATRPAEANVPEDGEAITVPTPADSVGADAAIVPKGQRSLRKRRSPRSSSDGSKQVLSGLLSLASGASRAWYASEQSKMGLQRSDPARADIMALSSSRAPRASPPSLDLLAIPNGSPPDAFKSIASAQTATTAQQWTAMPAMLAICLLDGI